MGASKQHMLEQLEDATEARCWKCDEPLESWTVIRAGHCPHCRAIINDRDVTDGWCMTCGKVTRPAWRSALTATSVARGTIECQPLLIAG